MAVPVRKASIGIAALAGASLLSAFPVAGQQVADAENPRRGSAACAHLDNKTDAGVRCEIRELDKNIERTKQRGIEADRQAATAREQAAKKEEASKCVGFLTEGVKDGRFNKAEILERAGGQLSADNACPIATKFYNYQRKAQMGVAPAVK